jgi:hypothetical protein
MVTREKDVEDKLSWYVGESFQGQKGRVNLLGLNLEEVDVDLSVHVLTNLDALEQQILEYMKYHAIIEGLDLLHLSEQMQSLSTQNPDEHDTATMVNRENRTLRNNRVIQELPSRQLGEQDEGINFILSLANLNDLPSLAKDNLF